MWGRQILTVSLLATVMQNRFVYLEKSSLLDYDGKISAVLFTSGCNFRCPFCHNPELVLPKDNFEYLSTDYLLKFLKKRQHKLDAIVITGGEPLIGNIGYLVKFLQIIKSETDYLVKLDTNGYNPLAIKKMIDLGVVDYWAMDIKNSLEKYSITTGVNVATKLVTDSIALIMNSQVDYEFRTTVIPDLHTDDSVNKIGQLIKGAKKHFIQNFRSGKTLDPTYSKKIGFSPKKLKDFQEIMSKYVQLVAIRE